MAALTSNTGTVLERYRYDAYGQRTVLAPDGIAVRPASLHGNQYGFTGRYLDKETGLWYFRARYYSGSLGRFVNRDPLGYVDGWNLYSAYFVPNLVDPTGMEECCCCCAKELSLEKVELIFRNPTDEQAGRLGHKFMVIVKSEYIKASETKKDKQCTLTWDDDGTVLGPDAPMMNNWKLRQHPCPGESKLPAGLGGDWPYLYGTPSISADARPRKEVRVFVATLKSAEECPCSQEMITLTIVQTLVWNGRSYIASIGIR